SLGHSGSTIHGKSRKWRLGQVISCVRSQLIAWNMCTDDQCSPSSATCQCPSVPALSAHPCHLPVPPVHINATYQCPSELPFIVTHQCQSVPSICAAYQCHLSVCISAAYQCCLTVPVSAAYQ
ncbi:unnamed protein product, partial [Staurois parvus]